jgi:predicted nucleotidyltransferase
MNFDLEKIVQSLAFQNVEFVVIGGVALSAYSSAYVTYDFDICYLRTPENLKRIVAALAPFNPRLRGLPSGLPFFWDERTLQNGTNFTLVTEVGDVDLLGEVAGIGTYKDALVNSITMDLLGVDVQVLTLSALVKAKTAAGRKKDLDILPEIEALREMLESE